MKRSTQEDVQTPYFSKLIHELNQPMTAIKAYLGGCELRLQRNNLSSEQMINVLQKINEHTELLQSKIDSLEEPIDIQGIMSEIISLYSYEIEHHHIRLILNFQEKFSNFHMSSFQIKHVLFRLIKLCIHAVENNKIQKPELEIQTNRDKTGDKIIIKTNFLIKEEVFERELTYCHTVLNNENGNLLIEIFANSICFQFMVY